MGNAPCVGTDDRSALVGDVASESNLLLITPADAFMPRRRLLERMSARNSVSSKSVAHELQRNGQASGVKPHGNVSVGLLLKLKGR